MPECSQPGWFGLAWDGQTLILSLHISLESSPTLSLLALITGPGIKHHEKLFLMGVEQKPVQCFSISPFSYSDTHEEDTVVISIEWMARHFHVE